MFQFITLYCDSHHIDHAIQTLHSSLSQPFETRSMLLWRNMSRTICKLPKNRPGNAGNWLFSKTNSSIGQQRHGNIASEEGQPPLASALRCTGVSKFSRFVKFAQDQCKVIVPISRTLNMRN
ncbi:hypothetical protein GQX74_003365 [Glossina fuscipes]|nr:hypothetical protein GQX74_003365 [Glossina fuscipes]